MAITIESDTKPEGKPRFSFRATMRDLAKKISLGMSASAAASNSANPETKNTNRGPQAIGDSPSVPAVRNASDLSKPLSEKPLPLLPHDRETLERSAKLAFSKIIAQQTDAFMKASAKLELGKRAPAPTATENSLRGADKASKLSPGATKHPRAARGDPVMHQSEPVARGPLQTARVVVATGQGKIVSVGKPGSAKTRSEMSTSRDPEMNRSGSTSSNISAVSADSHRSQVSAMTADSDATLVDVSSAARAQQEQPAPAIETRTRPPLHELYEVGIHMPVRGR